jgi:hypothetical protein
MECILNARGRALLEQLPQAFMPEASDHAPCCNQLLYICQ